MYFDESETVTQPMVIDLTVSVAWVNCSEVEVIDLTNDDEVEVEEDEVWYDIDHRDCIELRKEDFEVEVEEDAFPIQLELETEQSVLDNNNVPSVHQRSFGGKVNLPVWRACLGAGQKIVRSIEN